MLHSQCHKKFKQIDYVVRGNCRQNDVIEEKLEGTERRGQRRRQLLNDCTGKRRYWNCKDQAPDGTGWRARIGRGYAAVVRLTT